MYRTRLFLYFAGLVVCFLALQGCEESNQLTAWAISGQYTDLIARVGVENDGTEIGGVIKYGISDDIEWGPEPESAGAFLIFHLTQDVTVSDTLDPAPWIFSEQPADSPTSNPITSMHPRKELKVLSCTMKIPL